MGDLGLIIFIVFFFAVPLVGLIWRIIAIGRVVAAATRQAAAFQRQLEQLAQNGPPDGSAAGPVGRSIPQVPAPHQPGQPVVMPGVGGTTPSGVWVGVSPTWKR